jgi:hypothetical protein
MSIRRIALLAAAGVAVLLSAGTKAQTVDAREAMTVYQERTRAIRPCRAQGDAIVVCARDKAAERARYSLPLPEEARAAPPELMAERQRLMQAPTVPCGNGPILQNCGFVGVRHKHRF